MTTLPEPVTKYRVVGDPDDAWEIAVDGGFQAEANTEYEVVCIKPSKITDASWTDE